MYVLDAEPQHVFLANTYMENKLLKHWENVLSFQNSIFYLVKYMLQRPLFWDIWIFVKAWS